MSRLSKVALKGRESVFAGGSELYRGDIQASCPPSLLECVYSMEDCCDETYEAEQLLRHGTEDLGRMAQVLENHRVFLLVSEKTVRTYKAELREEVEPAITELIEKAEEGLKTLQKREALLRNKVAAAQSKHPSMASGATTTAQKIEQRRVNLLAKQRQRLEVELQALEEEVKKLESQVE